MLSTSVKVSSGDLACLLCTTQDPINLPEPYRLQSDIAFCIAYGEFKDYLYSQNFTDLRLCVSDDTLKYYYCNDNKRLYQSFLRIVAFAICKEVCYAERYNSNASIIIPCSDDNTYVMNATQIENQAYYLERSRNNLIALVEQYDYIISKVKSPHNTKLLNCASYLFKESNNEYYTGAELSINWDI